MADELVLDFAKAIGAFATDVVHSVENPCNDRKAGLRGDTLYRRQCSLGAVEHHAAQGAFDLAEEGGARSDATSRCRAGSARCATADPSGGSVR